MKIKHENLVFSPVTITLETPEELLFITKILGSLTENGKKKLGIETPRQFHELKNIVDSIGLAEKYSDLGEYVKLVVTT